MRAAARSGVTLPEVLIAAVSLAVVFGLIATLITRAARGSDRASGRLEARERACHALAEIRRELQDASSLEVDAGGQRLRYTRAGTSGTLAFDARTHTLSLSGHAVLRGVVADFGAMLARPGQLVLALKLVGGAAPLVDEIAIATLLVD